MTTETVTVELADLKELAGHVAEMDNEWLPPRRFVINRTRELVRKMLGDRAGEINDPRKLKGIK